ncbi:MAG TPA: DUF2868 domain-containing protein [Casimicrobiaceae bacterium]
MDEVSALEVIAVRAVETADGARTLWSDEDRAWASRAAAEVVGAQAAPETFIGRRATLAIERLGARQPALARTLRALRWRPWVGSALVGLAFALGVFLDQVDSAKRINIVAPPVLGLLIWNLAVYVAIVVGYVVRYGEDSTPGPLRGAIARVAGGLSRPRRGGGMRDAMLALFEDWARRSVPLYGVRAARILHLAAAALAVGVIAGLYLRGLAFEYRASWESTFLDAPTVRSIVAFAYAPGAFLTGIPVPAIEAVAAIRSPAGENAARWLHLMAATVVAIVILPRLLLALVAGVVERHRAAHLPLPLDEPYFQRLLRGYRGGPARVRVIPYSYTPAPAAIAGLEAVVTRAFGGNAAVMVTRPIAYGTDDALASDARPGAGTTLVALFNASATPEREVHGAFLATLAGQRAGAEAVLALIDEGAWSARWRSEPARISDRRAAWREIGEEARVPMVFVDLSAPDLAAAENALDLAIADGAR